MISPEDTLLHSHRQLPLPSQRRLKQAADRMLGGDFLDHAFLRDWSRAMLYIDIRIHVHQGRTRLHNLPYSTLMLIQSFFPDAVVHG